MYLEVVDSCLGPWGVQLAWAIQALDSRIVHEFRVGRMRLVGLYADGHVGLCRNGSVTHCAFEKVIRVGLLQFGEGVTQPRGWGRL
jgi:hypothetical protein